MRIAVDSSVLLDVLADDPDFGPASRRALRRAYDSGALMACEIVWSEVRAPFPDGETFRRTLAELGVVYSPLAQETAELAGARWRSYCLATDRRVRDRVVADFLIGAHALVQAEGLLSRDCGFFREGFEGLHLIDPAGP